MSYALGTWGEGEVLIITLRLMVKNKILKETSNSLFISFNAIKEHKTLKL